jgi:hypothetical protein
MADHPFADVLRTATHEAAEGADCYQKFTCSCCGQRLTMEEPNKFSEAGYCEACDHVTNIKLHGCNFLLAKDMHCNTPKQITVVKSSTKGS